jgi:hypothetical protein
LFENRARFVRVHDKKIGILFVGELMKLPESSLEKEVKVENLIGFFISVLSSLPKAIEKRNKMKLEEDREESEVESESSEYTENADDVYGDDLEEDIYFETPLDCFDPFGYIYGVLSSSLQGSYGGKMVNFMDESQKNRVSGIISVEQPKQII